MSARECLHSFSCEKTALALVPAQIIYIDA